MPKKLKNPEKYIERLKREVQEWKGISDANFESCRRAEGKYWFTYSKGVTKSVSLSSLSLAREVRLNSEVIIRGRVVEIKQGAEKPEVTFELRDVHYNE